MKYIELLSEFRMNLNKHFGNALKNYIEKRGIAVHKQAERVGVSYQGYIKYYESENPRLATKNKILIGLGITEEQLYEPEDKIDYKKKYEEEKETANILREQLLKYVTKQNLELQEQNIRADAQTY